MNKSKIDIILELPRTSIEIIKRNYEILETYEPAIIRNVFLETICYVYEDIVLASTMEDLTRILLGEFIETLEERIDRSGIYVVDGSIGNAVMTIFSAFMDDLDENLNRLSVFSPIFGSYPKKLRTCDRLEETLIATWIKGEEWNLLL